MYDYRVVDVVRVVDGDTLDLRLDLGFHLHTSLRFRLLGVDTPERGEPGWAEATEFVRRYLDDARDQQREVRATTQKADSFGRWLAQVYVRDQGGTLSGALLAAGHAVPYSR